MLPCFFIICLLRQCSVLCFDCLCLCFLRHYTISSMFPLFHYLIVTSPYYLLKVSIVLLSVCYVTALFLLRLSMPLFLTSLYYFFNVSLVSLSVCYVTILSLKGFHCFIICLLRYCSVLCFDCLCLCFLHHYTMSSMFPLFHYLIVTSPLFYYLFVTSLLFFMLRLSMPLFLTYYTISSIFSLFHYLLV